MPKNRLFLFETMQKNLAFSETFSFSSTVGCCRFFLQIHRNSSKLQIRDNQLKKKLDRKKNTKIQNFEEIVFVVTRNRIAIFDELKFDLRCPV
jgi:transcription initiation factor TFIID subunit TAF12